MTNQNQNPLTEYLLSYAELFGNLLTTIHDTAYAAAYFHNSPCEIDQKFAEDWKDLYNKVASEFNPLIQKLIILSEGADAAYDELRQRHVAEYLTSCPDCEISQAIRETMVKAED